MDKIVIVRLKMKAVILAGGLGTRISEESVLRPKPMIEIGQRPILWHIMKIYGHYGVTDFIVCLGYRGYMIKEYFANLVLHSSDVTINTMTGEIEYHQNTSEPWNVTLIETGEFTMTGGRLKRVAGYLQDDEPFCLTYGDGVSDVDIGDLIAFHKSHNKSATLTAVAPPGRYGALDLGGNVINKFIEKPTGENAMINGGFFVLDKAVLNRIESDETAWEGEPLATLAADQQLMAYKHLGFWHAMDTLRDKSALEALWASGAAPWKVWA